MKKIHQVYRFFLFSAGFLITVTGCRRHEPLKAFEKPVAVEIRTANLVQEKERIEASGSVASSTEPSASAFLVGGRAKKVVAREGDAVKKGQVLATLDAKEYELGLDVARAQRAAASVELSRAEAEYRRMKTLFDLHSLAPNDFDKYNKGYEAATKQLDQAAASEDIARKRVQDTVLVAPISGFIVKRMIEPGNVVAAGITAFQIAMLDPIEISVGIPEGNISLLRVGQKAAVRLAARPDTQFTGVVKRINVVADPATHTYSVRVAIPNSRHELLPGMIAEVGIVSDRQIRAIAVPGNAIVHNLQGANIVYVYYPEQKRVFSKQVEVGDVYGQDIRIKSGISANDQIVVAGQQFLRDGSLVDAKLAPTTSTVKGTK